MVGHNPRARASRRSAIKTTTRTRNNQKKHFRKVRIGNDIIAQGWDVTKTVTQNYKKLGLALDLNKTNSIAQHRADDHVEFVAQEEYARLRAAQNPTETISALQDYSKLETKIVTALSDGQQQLAQALIKKHGDDFKAMERDIKLNTHQKSKGQLKSLCTKYLAGLEEEEGSESESKEDKADE